MLRLLPLCVLLLSSVGVAQSTWYVPDDFSTIQGGIDGSANGDTVIVRDGTYVENINFNGKVIALASENGPLAAIIDGNQSGSVVIFNNGEGPATALDGFMLRNGRANWGGGVHCDLSSPTLNNCMFVANTASWDGAGMYCSTGSFPALSNCSFVDNDANVLPSADGGGMYCAGGSSPTLDNCMFANNIASSGGGGISFAPASSGTLENCVFTGNSCPYGGGAIMCRSSSLTLVNCTFKDNSATHSGGGGICFYYGSTGTVDNCVFEDNYADWEGGGVYCYSSSPAFKSCVFRGNYAVLGGGMYCDASTTVLSNCVFMDNDAVDGGGMYCVSSPSAVENCTFARNNGLMPWSQGGGICALGSSGPTLRSCIVWGNAPPNIEGAVNGVTYSCVQGGLGQPWFGSGCIDLDPLFVFGPEGDFYLSHASAGQGVDSPCVDSGDPTASAFRSTRTDGVADSSFVDMGFHYPVGGGSSPILSVANLVSGQAASIHVAGSTAGGKVFVAYSLVGGGPTSSSHGALLLSPPIEVLNSQIADSAGHAIWHVSVPLGASGVDVWLQALDRGSLSLSNGLALTVP